MTKKSKTPWPTKAVMDQIYEQHLWGGKDHDFFSGEGSHRADIIKPYLNAVIGFLKSHNSQLTVCDLGCGDFNIGQHLVEHSKSFIAVDIVKELIERNKSLFKNPKLEFKYLNAIDDELPQADCVIIRQVLQHLSNTEILKISKKLNHYKYIILTEHLPQGDFRANHDMISGQGNRIKYRSGVDLLQAPFNFEVNKKVVLNEVMLEDGNGLIKTILLMLQ